MRYVFVCALLIIYFLSIYLIIFISYDHVLLKEVWD